MEGKRVKGETVGVREWGYESEGKIVEGKRVGVR